MVTFVYDRKIPYIFIPIIYRTIRAVGAMGLERNYHCSCLDVQTHQLIEFVGLFYKITLVVEGLDQVH
jgi:hypothetical protein